MGNLEYPHLRGRKEAKNMKEEIEGQEPKEKTYTETEHKGIIADLQRERSERQQKSFELTQAQSRLTALETELKTIKEERESAKTKKSVIEGGDEDILTKKEGRDIESKVMSSIEKAQKVVKEAAEKERLDDNFKKSCSAARTRYADQKDIGLDFDAVYQAAISRVGGKKYRELAIYHSDDPGEELYQEGLKDPDIKAKLELAKNDKVLDSMGNRKVDKKGLTGESKKYGFKFYTSEEVAAMKPEEAREKLVDITKSSEKW